ncbi:MAG: hypothetical protein JSR59_20410 [Proteobacteria bacterium]|nr:hypothetical protein [Pseudomonadota bacterium]
MAGVVASWLFSDRSDVGTRTPIASETPAAGGDRGPAQIAMPRSARAPSPARAAVACVAQRFDVTFAGHAESSCVGATQVLQNGSLRSYRVDAQGHGTRWLVIDAAGNRVVSAALGTGDSPEFECRDDQCADIVVGEADLQGMRRIALDAARLPRNTGPGDDAVLTGQLTAAEGDADVAVGACRGQSVLISRQDAAPLHFCPDDGSSIDSADAGYVTYSFLGLDGGSIRVSFDAGGILHRVSYGALRCIDDGCAYVSIAPAVEGGRVMDFGGTLVQEEGGDGVRRNWATLTGRLLLP